MSVLTVVQAQERGYREAFITYPALGDQFLLLYAAKMQYALTGEKILVGTTFPELFIHQSQNYCNIIDNLDARTVGRLFGALQAACIEVIPLTYYQPATNANGQLRSRMPQQHILAEICSCMGLRGKIVLNPSFELTEEEIAFGRFFPDNQIAVISQGRELRKTWGYEKVQKVINTLSGRFNFVQIGAPCDAPLKHLLDKRKLFSLRKVASVLHNSDLFIGSIGALMHLARGVRCRSVITYSLSEPLHADSYPENCNLRPTSGCSNCQAAMVDPDNEDIECTDNFSCIRNITPEEVCRAVEEMMSAKVFPCPPAPLNIEGKKARPLTTLTARLFSMTHRGDIAKFRQRSACECAVV
jgi:CDP-glycerol glycerophosphotransferase